MGTKRIRSGKSGVQLKGDDGMSEMDWPCLCPLQHVHISGRGLAHHRPLVCSLYLVAGARLDEIPLSSSKSILGKERSNFELIKMWYVAQLSFAMAIVYIASLAFDHRFCQCCRIIVPRESGCLISPFYGWRRASAPSHFCSTIN